MSARRARGKCSSGKTRFRNRRACLQGIDLHNYRRHQSRTPRVALWPYRCPKCRGWHMTSQEQPSRKDNK